MTQDKSTDQPTPTVNMLEWEIKNRWTGAVICKIAGETFAKALEAAIRAGQVSADADLTAANLSAANLSGLRGDISGLYGNVDECEITQREREAGVDVGLLVEPTEAEEK